MNLNVDEWKEFYLGKLFDIRKGKRLTAADQEDGNNNYIGAIDSNNGVANHIGQAPIHEGNTISLSYNGSVGEAFYQFEPYWATDDVNALYSYYDDFNQYIGLFIATVLRKEKYKFSYGRKWTLENMNVSIIKLPIQHNADGTPYIDSNHIYSEDGYVPDWQFMEDYMKSLHHKPLTTKSTVGNGLELKVDKWEEFHIIDLFEIKRGNINSLNEVENGDVPIVSASGDNEGISFYGNVLAPYCNNITVSMNGVNTGFTAYHGYEFNINSDCCVLLQKFDMNQCIGIFIATVIGMLRYKYSYGRKMTVERISVENIRLPIQHNPDGTPYIDPNHTYSEDGYVPDWQFMEDYMKALPYGDRL